MAHLLKTPTVLNSGIVLNECFITHNAYFDKIETLGIVPLAFEFYNSIESKLTGYKPVIPIINDSEFINIKMPFNPSIFLSRSDKYISNYISNYFRNIFGYWNILDLEFEKLFIVNNIIEDSTLLEYNETEYEIVAIKIENSSNVDVTINITTENNVDIILSNEIILANEIKEFIITKSWETNKTILINSDDWNNSELNIAINLSLI